MVISYFIFMVSSDFMTCLFPWLALTLFYIPSVISIVTYDFILDLFFFFSTISSDFILHLICLFPQLAITLFCIWSIYIWSVCFHVILVCFYATGVLTPCLWSVSDILILLSVSLPSFSVHATSGITWLHLFKLLHKYIKTYSIL